MRFDDVIASIGRTPLVELARLSPVEGVQIFAKLEGHNPTGSVKDRIAHYMIASAEQSGELRPGKTILEPTSGNTGIALAMVGLRKGYPVTVVLPDNAGPERVEILRTFGAEIVFSPGDEGTNGSIEVAQQLARDPRYYMPYQYGNPSNPLAHYETTGAEILHDLPGVNAFVAGLGTGGTLMGVGRRLKEHDPSTQIVAVEPNPGERVQGLRSLEDGFVPPILDLGLLDSKFMVDTRDALAATRDLLRLEGIFAGISSGAVVHGAQRLAQRLGRGKIVCLLADGGWKYLSTGLWTRDLGEVERELGTRMLW